MSCERVILRLRRVRKGDSKLPAGWYWSLYATNGQGLGASGPHRTQEAARTAARRSSRRTGDLAAFELLLGNSQYGLRSGSGCGR